MKKLIGVYGASGFGREVVPLVKEQYPNAILCFIDDSISTERLNGLDVYDFEAFLARVPPASLRGFFRIT